MAAECLPVYTQYPIIRNGHIRHGAEISGNFKKPASKGSNFKRIEILIKKRSQLTIPQLRNDHFVQVHILNPF